MDKIERIRQEIERLKGICTAQIKANPGQTFPFVMEMTGYDKLLSFLKTLSEEPDKSLEEAAEEYADKHGFRVPYDGSNNYYDDVDVKASKEGFIAGAEWQKEQECQGCFDRDEVFLRGMKYAKEQMMEEAVEGEVIKTDKHTSVRYKSFYGTNRYFYGIADKQFKPGDKVRIIVLKEEEE